MLENEPTHLILCSKVRDGSILPTHCDWRKDAVFLEQITWDEVFARYGFKNLIVFFFSINTDEVFKGYGTF